MTAFASADPTAPPSPPGRTPAARRGQLTLADKVVEKIAGRAAATVPGTVAPSGGLFGIGADLDADARPKVRVTLQPGRADLALEIGVVWPRSIRDVTEQVRRQVTDQVQRLTGVTVHRVDIEVTTCAVPDRSQADRSLADRFPKIERRERRKELR